MKKLISAAGLGIGLALMLAPKVAFTQGEIGCEQEVIVQADDSLSKLANRFFGDVLAYPAIVEATNAKAVIDDSYARIDNADVIETGWKLCIPDAATAEMMLGVEGAIPVELAAVGPEVDRVGFPEGYQDNFQLFYEFDRPDNKSARVIYANPAAASVTPAEYAVASVEPGKPFPYGSILVMEVYRTRKDDADNVLLDDMGRYVRDELFGLFVMRKEPGFGLKYGQQRNGEWEYAAYRPDGTALVPPERTNSCAACHVEAGQAKDWVFGAHRAFGQETGEVGENEINVVDYTFQPNTLTVKVGTEVKWVNNDVIIHTVTANDISFNSGALRPAGSFTDTFEEAGEFNYFCAIHPSMTGKIIVTK